MYICILDLMPWMKNTAFSEILVDFHGHEIQWISWNLADFMNEIIVDLMPNEQRPY